MISADIPVTSEMKKCCVEGFLWTGKPSGSEVAITNSTISAYLAKPSGPPATNDSCILFIHDIFGWQLPNNRLLCDKYAEMTGSQVIMPDFFEGDAIGEPGSFKVPPMVFIESHPVSRTEDLIASVLSHLKTIDRKATFAAVGFCWGAKFALRLGKLDAFKSVVAAHPSLVVPNDDLVGLKAPTLFLLAEKDESFHEQLKEESFALLASQDTVMHSIVYPGTTHGFAVRGDQNNQLIAFARDDAAQQAIDWFNKYFI